MRSRDKERVLAELRSRVVDETVTTPGRVEEVLSDSVYHERKRLKDDRASHTRDEEFAFWNSVRDEMRRGSERAQIDTLKRVVDRYAREICGQFDERVYDAVTRSGEPMLGLLLNAVSPKKIIT